MHFDSAIEAQRFGQCNVNLDLDTLVRELKTPFLFEEHAKTMCNLLVFEKFQDEIVVSIFFCHISNENEDAGDIFTL